MSNLFSVVAKRLSVLLASAAGAASIGNNTAGGSAGANVQAALDLKASTAAVAAAYETMAQAAANLAPIAGSAAQTFQVAPANAANQAPQYSQLIGKNRLINGAMNVDQVHAGASQTFTAASAIAYCVDQWYASCTGANITGQRASIAGGYTLTGSAGNTGTLLGQRIESLNVADIANTNVTAQIKVSSTSLTAVTWNAYSANTQDNFSAKTLIATGNLVIGTVPTVYNFSFNTGPNAANGIAIEFVTGALLGGQTLTYSTAQLESGVVATTFERRPYGTELALCQRFIPAIATTQTNELRGVGQCIAATQAIINIQFLVQPRIPPTGFVASPIGNFFIWDANSTAISLAGLSLTKANLQTAQLSAVVGSGIVAGNATFLQFSSAGSFMFFTGCQL
jgi:hypothetical protein